MMNRSSASIPLLMTWWAMLVTATLASSATESSSYSSVASASRSSSSNINNGDGDDVQRNNDFHKIDLPFGDINILVLTDVHSWIAGHGRHHEESSMNVDYGDVLSFYETLKRYVQLHNLGDLYLVMNGDFMDGTGLSTVPPKHLTPLLTKMPFDVINLGNHELYFDDTVDWISRKFIPKWKGHYLTSNTLIKATGEPLGKRYTYLHGNDGNNATTILVFGFLYNFEGNCESTLVEKVQDVLRQEWFSHVLQTLNYGAILVMAHMHVTDPLIDVIRKAIRQLLLPYYGYDDMPIQFITGHTHIRSYAVLDEYAASFEAGRFLDTIGFVSFSTRRGTTDRKHNATTTTTSTEQRFPHVFLDANRESLEKLTGVKPLSTIAGVALTDKIHKTQYNLGLLETVGCSRGHYYLTEGMNLPKSIWGLYMHEIVPTLLLADGTTTSRILVQGTGAFRYDLFPGTVVVDDVIAVCPFNDTIYQISTLKGWQVLQVLNVSSTTPNEVLPEGSALPRWAVSTKKIDKHQSYDLLTSHFHVQDMVERVQNVLAYPIPDPEPVVADPASGQLFWTTTNLWNTYIEKEWPCGKATILQVPGAASTDVTKEEQPMAVFIFIMLIVGGLWVYQKRKQQLQRLGYMPMGDATMGLLRTASGQKLSA
jgi:2',3'-cyclic-nucleotide 2'-phosphodiesterase (5'-nucleotidase family)